MDFLRKELNGLPPEIVAAIYKQLERAIRGASMISTEQLDSNQAIRIVSRISSVLEFAATLRKQQDESNPI